LTDHVNPDRDWFYWRETMIAEPTLLVAFSEALRGIDLSATDPTTDILGQRCRMVAFDHFMITVPDPGHVARIG
jgi:hypothetical protein